MLLNHPYADFYKLNGHPPWARIAEHPSQHITKKSRPNSDHQLQELSYMKSDGVNAWLRHWLKLQKRNKCPLILKDSSDEAHLNLTSSSKGKAKASKAWTTGDDKSDQEDVEEDGNSQSDEGDIQEDQNDQSDEGDVQEDKNDQSDNKFLATLSKDKNYQKLLLLICAANVSNMLLSVDYNI